MEFLQLIIITVAVLVLFSSGIALGALAVTVRSLRREALEHASRVDKLWKTTCSQLDDQINKYISDELSARNEHKATTTAAIAKVQDVIDKIREVHNAQAKQLAEYSDRLDALYTERVGNIQAAQRQRSRQRPDLPG